MIINVENLVKTYPLKNVPAVKGISFGVQEGNLFSFLGTNGAGKSTTIKILTTLLTKTSGMTQINGLDVQSHPQKVRQQIGVVFQDSVMDNYLSPRENLHVRGSLYGYKSAVLKEKVNHVIKMTGIEDFADRLYMNLSGGQRRRTDIARALIHAPRLLFLDEPTTGLDPKTRRDIWELIKNLQKENGMTVFLTTHYMEEAAESDDIAIINKGEIIARGTPAQLKAAYSYDTVKLVLKDGTSVTEQLKQTKDSIAIIDQYRDRIEHMEVLSGTLDDVFLRLTEQEEMVDAYVG